MREYHRARTAVDPAYRQNHARKSRVWYQENLDQARANRTDRVRSWRKRNPGKEFAKRVELKLEMIQAYGGRCVCCEEVAPEFLSIDHINGGGRKDRGGFTLYRKLKKLGWPKDEFRLLCFNCNLARGFYSYCPHESETI